MGPRKEWLTIHEASDLIGVSSATLRRWSDAGDIKAFTTPGGHRRFSRAAVLGMLPASRRRRPNLVRLGETPEHLTRLYRRNAVKTANGVAWLEVLGEADRELFREHGRRMATSLLAFVDGATPDADRAPLDDAERAAAEYGRIAGERRIGMHETVDTFLRFRMVFLHELAVVARRHGLDTTEATDLLESATEAVDRLLGVLMEGYETATSTPCQVGRAVGPGRANGAGEPGRPAPATEVAR
jgi:excisionase family DNA binding protein